MIIRPESISDVLDIYALNAACFPTEAEAQLVDALREEGSAVLSYVACASKVMSKPNEGMGEKSNGIVGPSEATVGQNETIIGHVMLSRMQAPANTIGLAPVAVAEEARKQGIAAKLIQAALEEARKQGFAACFVLGDPAYYARFGFAAHHAQVFESPYAGPYFMAMPLQEGGLDGLEGPAQYAPAFDAL